MMRILAVSILILEARKQLEASKKAVNLEVLCISCCHALLWSILVRVGATPEILSSDITGSSSHLIRPVLYSQGTTLAGRVPL